MARSPDSPDDVGAPFSRVVPGARPSRVPRRFVTVVGVAVDSARKDELPSLEPETSRVEPRARPGSGVHVVGPGRRPRFDDEPEVFAFTLSGLGESLDVTPARADRRETFGDVLEAALALPGSSETGAG